MREYAIEYADRDLLTKIISRCVVLFLLIEVLLVTFVSNDLTLTFGLVVGLSLPVTCFLANQSKIRKTGVILVGHDRIAVGISDEVKIIDLSELVKCQVTNMDGTVLTLVSKNGHMLRIIANNNFCDSSKLAQACSGIEEAIQNYILGSNKN